MESNIALVHELLRLNNNAAMSNVYYGAMNKGKMQSAAEADAQPTERVAIKRVGVGMGRSARLHRADQRQDNARTRRSERVAKARKGSDVVKEAAKEQEAEQTAPEAATEAAQARVAQAQAAFEAVQAQVAEAHMAAEGPPQAAESAQAQAFATREGAHAQAAKVKLAQAELEAVQAQVAEAQTAAEGAQAAEPAQAQGSGYATQVQMPQAQAAQTTAAERQARAAEAQAAEAAEAQAAEAAEAQAAEAAEAQAAAQAQAADAEEAARLQVALDRINAQYKDLAEELRGMHASLRDKTNDLKLILESPGIIVPTTPPRPYTDACALVNEINRKIAAFRTTLSEATLPQVAVTESIQESMASFEKTTQTYNDEVYKTYRQIVTAAEEYRTAQVRQVLNKRVTPPVLTGSVTSERHIWLQNGENTTNGFFGPTVGCRRTGYLTLSPEVGVYSFTMPIRKTDTASEAQLRAELQNREIRLRRESDKVEKLQTQIKGLLDITQSQSLARIMLRPLIDPLTLAGILNQIDKLKNPVETPTASMVTLTIIKLQLIELHRSVMYYKPYSGVVRTLLCNSEEKFGNVFCLSHEQFKRNIAKFTAPEDVSKLKIVIKEMLRRFLKYFDAIHRDVKQYAESRAFSASSSFNEQYSAALFEVKSIMRLAAEVT